MKGNLNSFQTEVSPNRETKKFSRIVKNGARLYYISQTNLTLKFLILLISLFNAPHICFLAHDQKVKKSGTRHPLYSARCVYTGGAKRLS